MTMIWISPIEVIPMLFPSTTPFSTILSLFPQMIQRQVEMFPDMRGEEDSRFATDALEPLMQDADQTEFAPRMIDDFSPATSVQISGEGATITWKALPQKESREVMTPEVGGTRFSLGCRENEGI